MECKKKKKKKEEGLAEKGKWFTFFNLLSCNDDVKLFLNSCSYLFKNAFNNGNSVDKKISCKVLSSKLLLLFCYFRLLQVVVGFLYVFLLLVIIFKVFLNKFKNRFQLLLCKWLGHFGLFMFSNLNKWFAVNFLIKVK